MFKIFKKFTKKQDSKLYIGLDFATGKDKTVQYVVIDQLIKLVPQGKGFMSFEQIKEWLINNKNKLK